MGLKEHEYIRQTLERYTNCQLEEFCGHVLITNFRQYIRSFADRTGGELHDGNFRIVNAPDLDCTMIDFGIGSPQAALVINGLAYLDNLKSVVMLGMCGGIDDILEVGDFVVPDGRHPGEGTSRHYLPVEFPALPAMSVNLLCIGAVKARGTHTALRRRLYHRQTPVGV
jgi:AMP nucleosidase